jgi:S-(hydroxymethyl)glutathione dehydrogenase/alcohol dehydrogenase|tara:strand:+ start:5590 stop:6633 length:1044 start_codon:yes stop_codon:yes gene_type:complete
MDLIIKAAVLETLNQPLKIKLLKPEPLKTGQVLVKILFSGVCRSQVMEVQGMRGEDKWLPHLLGHEGSGIVEETGPGVTKLKKGDEVILTWIKADGLQASGARYHCEEQQINSGAVTTFSNYSVVSENRLVIKPKDIPFDIAILLGCALPTGCGMVHNQLNISPNSNVAVIGLGGIGLSAILMLLAKKVQNIIAIDISNEKLEMVKNWGVINVFHSDSKDLHKKIMNLTEGGLDFCIESAGQINTIELGFALLKKSGGELLFASHPPQNEKISLSPHELISGKRISGSWGGGTQPDKDFPALSKMLMPNRGLLNSLITQRYSLDQINLAIEDLSLGRVFRPLIEMEH